MDTIIVFFPLEIRHIQLFRYLILTKLFSSQRKYKALCFFISFQFRTEIRPKGVIQVSEGSGVSHNAFPIKRLLPTQIFEHVGNQSSYSSQDGQCGIPHSLCSLQCHFATLSSRSGVCSSTLFNLERLCDRFCLQEASCQVRSVTTLRPLCYEKPKRYVDTCSQLGPQPTATASHVSEPPQTPSPAETVP